MEHTPTTPSNAPQDSSLDQPDLGAEVSNSTYDQGFDSYTLEQLSVKDPGKNQQTQPQATYGQNYTLRSDSKRKALIISTLITLTVLLITLGSLFVFSNTTNKQNELAQSTPEQDINLGGQFEQISIPGIDEASDSLLINGDLVTRGVIKLSQNGFVASLDAGEVRDNRTYRLPDNSGTFCLDTNNCNFITSEDFAALQAQVGQIVIPNVPNGTSINGFTNSVTVTGTPNQVNVVSANGLITLSTPQNIAPTSSPTFNNQTLTGNLNVGGTLQLGLNCTSFQNGGALTTNGFGQVICSDDDNSGGTGFVTTLNSLTGDVDIIDAGSGLISVNVNGQNIELSIQNNSIGNTQLAFNTGQHLTTLSSPTFSGLSLSQLSLGGDVVADLTGNGLQVIANILTLSIQPNKGLEVDSNGLSLIDCGDGQVLKYETTGNTWGCANDENTGGAPTNANYIVFGSLDPALTDERQLTFGTNLQFVDGGANGTLAVSVVNNPTFSGQVTANGGLTFGAGQSLTINGDSFTDLTGAGLQVVGNVLQTTLGTSIDTSEIVDGTILAIDFNSTNVANAGTDNYVLTYDHGTGGFTWVDPAVAGGPRVDSLNTLTGDLSIVGSAGQIIITPSGGDTFTFSLDAAVSLLGQTIGLAELEANSVDSSKIVDGSINNADLANSSLTVTAGNGLISGGSVSLGGSTTLDINTGNGLTIIADAVTLAVQANKGLEVDGSGLSLIDCGVGQILKYNGSNQWACAADDYEPDTNTTYTAGNDLDLIGTTFHLQSVLNTVTDIIRDSGNLTLQTTTSGNIVLDSAGTINLLDQTNIEGQLYLGTNSGINGALSFYNSTNSNTVTLQSGATGASYTLTLPTGLGSANQCLKAQDGTGTLFWDNCLGGGGGGIAGSGTTGRIARFTPDGTTIGDSSLTDDGTNATATGDFSIQGGGLTLGTAAQSGSIVLNDGDGDIITLLTPNVSASYSLTLPTAAGSNTECLRVDGTGQLYFDTCSGGGSGSGVDSLRSLTGALNLQGTANEIEITDNGTNAITVGLPDDVTIGNTLTVTGLATFNGGLTIQNGDIFTFGGNGYTSLTGTGLQFNAGSLEATLGTSVDLTSEVTGILPVANGGTGQNTLNNLITLTTHTVGDYVASFTAGGGLTGNASGEGSTPTLAVGAGNGITVNADDITLNLQANKGLEVDVNGLSLIDCADGQVLKYQTAGNTWACAADAGGSGVGDDILVNGVNADGANFLNSAASATNAAITWGLNTASSPDEITLSIGVASATEAGIVTANAQTFGGNKTFNGQIIANGNIGSTGALSITPGGALTVGSTGQSALLQGSTTTITSTGAGNDITLTSADALILTAAGNITLTGLNCTLNTNGGKLTTDASGNVTCQDDVNTDTNTTYSAGNDLNLVGTTFNLDAVLNTVTDIIRDSGNLTLQTTTSGNIILNSAGTIELQDNTNVTGTLGVSGLATFNSALRIYDGTANYFTINAEGALSGNYSVSIPAEIAGNDFFCLENAGNCSGAGASSVGTIDSQSKSANGAVISANTLYLQTADNLNPGLVSTGSQLFAGDKTFDGEIFANAGINLGTRVLRGTTATIDFSNFDVDASGNTAMAGNLQVNGGNIGISTDPALLQLASGALTVNGMIVYTAAGADNDAVVCRNSSGQLAACNSTFATTTDLNGYATTALDNLASVNINTALNATSNNLTLQTTTSGNIILNSAGTIELQDNTNITGNLVATGNGTFQGGNINIGVASTTTGNLNLFNSGSAFAGSLQVAALGQASTYILPDPSAASDTICLQGLGNCSGAGASSVGTIDSQTKSADGAVISSNTLYLQTADHLNPGLVSTGTQTFAGDKTFNGSVTLAAQQTLTITGSTTANRPGSPTEGMIYYDTDTNQLLTYANGKWQADRSAYVLVAANNSSQANKDAADYVAGGTGDQVEINAALTAAAAAGGKGKVYLLAGTYIADGTILIPNNTTLAGAGNGTVIQLNVGAGDDNLIENSDTTTGTGVTIRDLKLDGSLGTGGNQDAINATGIGNLVGDVPGIYISFVTITNFQDDGIFLNTAQNSSITNNQVLSANSQGIELVNSVGNVINNNVASDNNTGIYLNADNTNNTVSNNTLTDNTHSIFLAGNSNFNTISQNTIKDSVQIGIRISGSKDNLITSNAVHNSNGTTANNAIQLSGFSHRNTITGNYITDTQCDTTCYAISITSSDAQANYIANNYITDSDPDDDWSINDLGTGTIYGGQVNDIGDFGIQPAGDIHLVADTHVIGTLSVANLGSADSDTLLCHNTSNQIAECSSTFVTDSTNAFVRNGTTTQTANFNIQSAAAGSIGGIIQGHASQTADLLQIRNGASAVLASVTSDGILKVGTTAAPTLAGAKLLVNSGEFTANLRLGDGTNRVEWDSTSSKLRFVGAARNDVTVTMVPEFVGATFRGDGGGDNVGYLTSDFCSGTSLLSVNTGVCASTSEHNYYEWTTAEATAQDYDMYVRYRLPSDFDGFFDNDAIKLFARTTDTTDTTVQLAIFRGATQCGSTTTINNSNNTWQETPLTGNETSCGFLADEIMTIRIRVRAGQNDIARVGALSFVYKSKF